MTVSRFPDAPPQIAALPVDKRGYPVPAFVPWIDGEPEFRAVEPGAAERMHKSRQCWVCGRPLPGDLKTFVIGPMCAVNRISSEPPSHRDCAHFAAVACPFLTRPMAKRRRMDGAVATPGMIERNPGVTLVWTTRTYRTEKQAQGGMLFRLGTPTATTWYAEGRPATHDEIMASITSGLPLLRELAEQEGPEAMFHLGQMVGRAVKLIPA